MKRRQEDRQGGYLLILATPFPFLKPLLHLVLMRSLTAASLIFALMVEWGPSEVMEAEIRKMEEDGLAPEEILVVS